MATVEFKNIAKVFGALPVLHSLDMAIDEGEFVVLLGPSGCGKTTLLNILAGLLEQSSGQVFIGGKDVSFLDPKDRGIAMVFQSYALYPTKTVRGNLKFGLTSRNLTNEEIDRRIDWVAKLLQIDALLDRKPAQLSGGQRQRVAIGRALVKQVRVCLFDEPLSNLDAKLRTEMRIEIKKLHTELRNTVVYVTHDQVEAMTMATKIAVMNKGRIEQIGGPDEIYERPETLFVAQFVGSPSMNMIDATVRVENDRVTAVDDINDFSLDLTHCVVKRPLASGQRLRIGIRPEHLKIGSAAQSASEPAAQLRLRPTYCERLGAEAILFLAMGKTPLAARITPEAATEVANSECVLVSIPVSRLHLFDEATGHRL